MVILVVMLLTTAILFRSFDRTKNVSNMRVSQQVMNAALPAIDRAKAKIDALLNNQTTRGTPDDKALNDELIKDKYNLGDENRLQLSYNGDTNINSWRFPVDTDNNGKFDSFTLYSILFRTPLRATNGNDDRQRTPLEARTIPMQEAGRANPNCPQAAGTSASLTGYQGWYKSGTQLKRSFFAYVATVPITQRNQAGLIPAASQNNYENYKGNKSFSALEFQQDKGKVSVANNAILYEDDLDISPGGGLTVNGRIQTNSNLFVTKTTADNNVNLRQVSSNDSCYYEAVNGKIIVGGNLASGTITGATTTGDINIDLFEGTGDANDPRQNQALRATETSLTDSPAEIAYNTQAYEARINKLVQLTIARDASGDTDPTEVKEGITEARTNDRNITVAQARQDQLDRYFRERTRRVPFKEVPYSGTAPLNDPLLGSIGVTGEGDNLQPTPPQVMYPFDNNGRTGTNYSEMTLNVAGNNLLPSATEFSKQEADTTGREPFLGDRILVGNNLPQDFIDQSGNWSSPDTEQQITGINWNDPPTETRTRKSRVTLLSDVADARRNGFWEKSAVKRPVLPSDGVGGLRVITGAGVYLPPPRTPLAQVSTVVWPDTMPVIPPSAGRLGVQKPSWLPDNPFTANDQAPDFPVDATGNYRPYLQMRATAVYHYTNGNRPIACVSSFYDPTDKYTARNTFDPFLPDVSGNLFDPNPPRRRQRDATKYNSNNGVTYGPPTATEQSVRYLLNEQAQLVYPNGRLVNPLLKDALATIAAMRNPAQQAAVDSTLCALQILGYRNVPPITPTPTPSGYPLPHGTIQEVAFLDGRQIKAIDGQDNPATLRAFDTNYLPTGKYDLAVEQRQPLEIRATVLNLNNLRQGATPAAPYARPEFMLPNSGIIYATRDDALPDGTQAAQQDYSDARDDASDPNGKQVLKLSASDFQLDLTRRPNGIMLTNGLELWRDLNYREEEKGLILASNTPVYIQATPVPAGSGSRATAITGGGFNLHKNGSDLVEEFTQPVANGFYNRTTLERNFACRSSDPRLPSGACNDPDRWRAATVIADSVTLLSNSTDPTKPFSGFKAGYRSDGDYDLRNNEIDNIANADTSTTALELQTVAGNPVAYNLDGVSIERKRLEQGFWNNNFVTTRNFTDTAYSRGTEVYTAANPSPTTDTVNSSYFNNAVTPVQRRGQFSEYLMEMCSKRVVSDCTANDWSLDPLGTGAGAGTKATTVIGQRFIIRQYPSGTTAQFPAERAIADNPELARLPRRVAFARDDEGRLILSTSKKPIPLGIDRSVAGRIACYTYDAAYTIPRRLTGSTAVTCQPYSSTAIRQAPNALWFATAAPSAPNTVSNYGYDLPLAYMNLPQVNSPLPLLTTGLRGTTNQPLLVPVLQLQAPRRAPANALPTLIDLAQTRYTNWLPRAAGDTTFNLIMAVGDSPSHPRIITPFSHAGDFNGGVQNLPRFLENWIQTSATDSPLFNTNISGSFIQIKRSYYATAPFTQLSEGSFPTYPTTRSIFGIYKQGYPTNNTSGKAPYYEIPNRNWGFDVGLLAQVPDLFSNQFVLAPTGKPNEFFREVNRNDEWVQTLLCAKIIDDPTVTPPIATSVAVNSDQRPNQFCQSRSGS
ncbi:MAG TPA: hypothetical protein DCP31_17475 [Cyanobacteria bacterium UBA8543]|nr:hypothetical protein [Cyanobacteria bacterium UBA8543]